MAFSATFAYQIVDRYTKVANRMSSATDTLRLKLMYAGEGMDKAGSKLGKMSSKLANLRTGFAATMLTMGLKGAIKSSLEFETIMNKVEAVTQATSVQMKDLRKEAKKQGLETRFSAVQAAEGMAVLGQRGFKTANIISLIPKVLSMATAGDLELADASDILVGTLKTFSLGIDQATRVGNVFAITASNSASDMVELNSAMINAGPLAAAAGVEFEELASLVGAMAEKNIKGAQAGTLLMNAFRNLVKPSAEAIAVLTDKKFGFKKDEVSKASGELVSFTRLMELFEERGIGISEIFRIFQVRGAKAVAALRGQIPVSRELIKKYSEQSYAMKRMAETMEKGMTGTVHRAISAWEGLKTAIGEGLSPWTTAAAEKVTGVFKYIAGRPRLSASLGKSLFSLTGILSVVTILGVFFGSLYAITLGWGVAVSVVGLMFSPILLVVLALAAAISLVIKRWDKMKEGVGWLKPFLKLLNEKMKWKLYESRHKDILATGSIMEREAARSTLGPLSTSMSTPEKTASSQMVEVMFGGALNINDYTKAGVSSTPDAGPIPININKRGGAGGSWGRGAGGGW